MSMIRPSDPDFRIYLVDFNTLIEIQSDAERLGFATRWTSVDALRGQAKEQGAVLKTLTVCGRSGRGLFARTGCAGFGLGGWSGCPDSMMLPRRLARVRAGRGHGVRGRSARWRESARRRDDVGTGVRRFRGGPGHDVLAGRGPGQAVVVPALPRDGSGTGLS
jgi:hypothetical protein